MKKIFILLAAAVTFGIQAAPKLAFNITSNPQTSVVKPQKSGTYWIVAHTESLIPAGKQHFAKLRINDGPLLTRRLLGFNYTKARAHMERIALEGGKSYKIFFQYDKKTTVVTRIQLIPQKPYPVRKEARNYRPKLIPPGGRHPRLFVNQKFLTELKKNLNKGDNLPIWTKVKKTALTPYPFKVDPAKEYPYDAKLLAAVNAKAFYHLVTGDKKIGREAVELVTAYINIASFGNGQDICRRVGELIYSASLVYDWCYSLVSVQEKALLRKRMLFYASELEAGWPPFKQFASAGHGNEAQFNRDLLSMSLAIYDEDPLPYQYVAWQLFELWLPLKQLTYLSGRHSQGTSYGQYRAQFDFIAALQIWRVWGIKVLPDEAKDLPLYWYYLRLPDGCFLIEGDDNWKVTRPQYIPLNQTLLYCLMALYPNPDFKMELRRHTMKIRRPIDPILFLLSNDPNVKPQDLRAKLPLTRLFKDPLPGMAVRTGWKFTNDSDDLVLTMNGGNRHLVNHQHRDQGSFQLFYRGYLITELGQYRYYNLPYDRQLNKTAGVHAMMRFKDPDAKRPKWLKTPWVNVGGQNFFPDRPPFTAKSLLTDKRFYCGETPRAGFGPSKQKPVYNFLETSLAPSYLGRVKNYNRSFVFWNQNDPNRPGTLLILDRFATTRSNIEPIFQLTSVKKPVVKGNTISLTGKRENKTGRATITTLIPAGADIKVLTDKAARTFDGVNIPPRFPNRREAKGSRIEITGKGNVYLHAIQVHDGKLAPRPVSHTRSGNRIQVILADTGKNYLTNFGNVDKVTKSAFSVKVPQNNTHVLLLDLAKGKWTATLGNKKQTFDVTEKEGHIYGVWQSGTWKIQPVRK